MLNICFETAVLIPVLQELNNGQGVDIILDMVANVNATKDQKVLKQGGVIAARIVTFNCRDINGKRVTVLILLLSSYFYGNMNTAYSSAHM